MTARKNPHSRRSPGTYSALTAREIEQIRTLHDAIRQLHEQRRDLCHRLGIDLPTFGKYGRRDLGKKPANTRPRQIDTIDWVAQHTLAE